MAYEVPNGAKLLTTFKGDCFGQLVMNTFHHRWEGPTIANGLAWLIQYLTINAQMQAMHALWQDCIGDDVGDCRVVAQWIWPIRYRQANAGMVNAGGSGGLCRTANVGSSVAFVGDLANRHGVANKHLPALASVAQDNGTLTPAAVTKIDSFAFAYQQTVPILGGVLVPIIYNRNNPAASVDIIGHITNPNVRVQRRRTVGLGK